MAASSMHAQTLCFLLMIFGCQRASARNMHGDQEAIAGRNLLRHGPAPQDVSLAGYDVPAELPQTSKGFKAEELAALELAMPRVSRTSEGQTFFHRLLQSSYPAAGEALPWEFVADKKELASSAPTNGQPDRWAWRHDVFTSPRERLESTYEGTGFSGFFRSADFDEWTMLLIAVIALVMFDGICLKNLDHTNTRTNLAVLAFWLAAAAVYNGVVWARMGVEPGLAWCSGYFLEWLLSMDNIFVFHLIFRVYKTPAKLLHKSLFWGIIGAVVFRALFFMTLSTLLHMVHWFRFVFGVLLIYSGVAAAREEEEDDDPTQSWPVVALRACLGSRIDDSYDEETSGLFVWKDGQFRATLLVPVIMCLEVTDILFAVDSVSAKVAQIPDPYICYSSSVLAMFGLRAMFFVMRDLVEYFDLLKYGLCFVLVFIGIELMIADYVKLPAHVVLIVIVAVFGVCIAASAAKKLKESDKHVIASVKETKNSKC